MELHPIFFEQRSVLAGKSLYDLETATYDPTPKVTTAIKKAIAESEHGNSIRTTTVAKLLRVALKEQFPTTTFSVKSKSYSGGSSINIRWEDGPRDVEVKPITDFFQGASFDGMTDSMSYRHRTFSDNDITCTIRFGADFVFTNRSYSETAEHIADTTPDDFHLFQEAALHAATDDYSKRYRKLRCINFENLR